jgi:hypothetical protein
MLRFSNQLVPQILLPGLQITVSAAYVFLSGANTRASIPATTVTLASNATNYVFFNGATRTVQVNQTGFPNPSYPIAIAVTSASGVVALSDQRSDGIA